MTKDTARDIWFYIKYHAGFAEDRGEWMYSCDLREEDVEDFMVLVSSAIEGLGDEK